MATIGSYKRSGSNGKTILLRSGSGKHLDKGVVIDGVVAEASNSRELEPLSVPKRLARSVSQKLKKKSMRGDGEDEGKDKRGSYGWKCLGLYAKGGGCKVGADTGDEFGDGNGRRKSSVGEEGMEYRAISGIEEARVDCFSYGVAERFWRWNSRKAKETEQHPSIGEMQFSLPDDILEMCLARVSLSTLMNARLVCKKWRALTSTPHFMQIRCKGFHQSPWLFLFGAVKDGYCSGQIHALDVSLDRWHRLDADILRGRFLFSVASVGSDIYVVGGCSSLANFGRVDKSSFKTHKGVLVFSPLTGLWRKAASMKSARSGPILGVFEVDSVYSIFQTRGDRQDRRPSRSRVGGVSDVYEDPHRFSLRRQLRDVFNDTEDSSDSRRKSCKFVKQESNQSDAKEERRFVLIAVGGHGYWDEPLDSGEIYDPLSNKWMDIGRLPGDFGVACSGSICNGVFYVYSETDKLAGYDLERGIWIGIQTSHPPPRLHEFYPKLVSCNGRLFMLCVSWCQTADQVSRGEKAVRKIWEVDLSFHTWYEVSKHPDAPMDWNAAFVADRGMIFGSEMFKIFGQVLDFWTVCNVSDSELKWNRISSKHVAHEVDASSCMTKTIAVVHL